MGQGLGWAFNIDSAVHLRLQYDNDPDWQPTIAALSCAIPPLGEGNLDDRQGSSARELGSAEGRRDGPKITRVAPAGEYARQVSNEHAGMALTLGFLAPTATVSGRLFRKSREAGLLYG